MKELSLNILDIAQNSVTAKSTLIEIYISETQNELCISLKDNGIGMSKEMVESVTNPFCTTRTTRKVGLGIPLLKLAAEQTGGSVTVDSKSISDFPDEHGTVTTATFNKNHIDFTPLGDVVCSICTLIQGFGDIDLIFKHTSDSLNVLLDTRVLRETLGEIPLSNPEVLMWINEFLKEQYNYSKESEEKS